MNRKEAREFVMQAVFQMEAQKDFEHPDINKYLSRENLGNNRDYAEKLLTAIAENIEEIDAAIDRHSEGWPHTRMTRMDLAIIRVACGEMKYLDMAPAVSINEAVNMAKKYGTEQSPKFVNAVLGKF